MNSGSSRHKMKKRVIERYQLADSRYFIFCEGEKTEPQYFEGLKKAIEKNPLYRGKIFIDIEGVGAETIKVIEAAEKKVNDLELNDAQVWCIYDKDSFPDERFNRVAEKANELSNNNFNVKYNVGWSNQCIEYWFILHFNFYDINNDRKYYIEFLNKRFKKLGIGKYKKNSAETFEILQNKGNPKQAISWAKQRLGECSGLTDSQSAPATKAHELVEELARFLPDDLRYKYITD